MRPEDDEQCELCKARPADVDMEVTGFTEDKVEVSKQTRQVCYTCLAQIMTAPVDQTAPEENTHET